MIVEINKYASKESLILVSEIVSVRLKELSNNNSGNSLADRQHEFSILLKQGHELNFWFNGEKEQCITEYQKVKDALSIFYRKDTIKEELQKYIAELSGIKN